MTAAFCILIQFAAIIIGIVLMFTRGFGYGFLGIVIVLAGHKATVLLHHAFMKALPPSPETVDNLRIMGPLAGSLTAADRAEMTPRSWIITGGILGWMYILSATAFLIWWCVR
jgi:hypothetical protein